MEILKKLASSCINLYGVISIQEFLDIYNKYCKSCEFYKKIDRSYVIEFLLSLSDDGVIVYSDYIVDTAIYQRGESCIQEVLFKQKDKAHRYLPSHIDEFCSYGSKDYYVNSKYAKTLIRYICGELNVNTEKATSAVKEILYVDLTGINADINIGEDGKVDVNHYFIIYSRYGINFKTEHIKRRLLTLTVDMYNNLRLWENKGYTPNEMEELGLYDKKTIQSTILVKKIDRNASCPCGSGKKYKNCCIKDK